MEIHNLMEDLVVKTVQEICDEEERKAGEQGCTSPECRLDVTCFVLNRIPQQYVSSGRGAAHAEKTLKENPQLKVDIVTLAHKGLKRVSQVRRPYYESADTARPAEGPAFCFPVLKGRLLSCTTFAPIQGVAVSLRMDGEPVGMIDQRWQNPFPLDPKIEGTFLFYPRPEPADRAGMERLFELEIFVEDSAFETFHHFFKVGIVSEAVSDPLSRKTADHRIEDLYLVPK